MNRRTAVRNIVVISAGASLFSRCTSASNDASIPLKNISVTGAQQTMLADLAEAIIPKTNNFIGAADLKTHEFILTMVDDCMSPEDQKSFTNGMKAFGDACQKKFNTAFVKFTPAQKSELLKEMETRGGDDEAAKFYKTVKGYTIRSFATSKDFLVNVRKWKLVPGPVFKGCVPVTA